MLFLCSNDDGILAPGLATLEAAARTLGDVFVVAPDREQSATSHSLTLHHPLRDVERMMIRQRHDARRQLDPLRPLRRRRQERRRREEGEQAVVEFYSR